MTRARQTRSSSRSGPKLVFRKDKSRKSTRVSQRSQPFQDLNNRTLADLKDEEADDLDDIEEKPQRPSQPVSKKSPTQPPAKPPSPTFNSSRRRRRRRRQPSKSQSDDAVRPDESSIRAKQQPADPATIAGGTSGDSNTNLATTQEDSGALPLPYDIAQRDQNGETQPNETPLNADSRQQPKVLHAGNGPLQVATTGDSQSSIASQGLLPEPQHLSTTGLQPTLEHLSNHAAGHAQTTHTPSHPRSNNELPDTMDTQEEPLPMPPSMRSLADSSAKKQPSPSHATSPHGIAIPETPQANDSKQTEEDSPSSTPMLFGAQSRTETGLHASQIDASFQPSAGVLKSQFDLATAASRRSSWEPTEIVDNSVKPSPPVLQSVPETQQTEDTETQLNGRRVGSSDWESLPFTAGHMRSFHFGELAVTRAWSAGQYLCLICNNALYICTCKASTWHVFQTLNLKNIRPETVLVSADCDVLYTTDKNELRLMSMDATVFAGEHIFMAKWLDSNSILVVSSEPSSYDWHAHVLDKQGKRRFTHTCPHAVTLQYVDVLEQSLGVWALIVGTNNMLYVKWLQEAGSSYTIKDIALYRHSNLVEMLHPDLEWNSWFLRHAKLHSSCLDLVLTFDDVTLPNVSSDLLTGSCVWLRMSMTDNNTSQAWLLSDSHGCEGLVNCQFASTGVLWTLDKSHRLVEYRIADDRPAANLLEQLPCDCTIGNLEACQQGVVLQADGNVMLCRVK